MSTETPATPLPTLRALPKLSYFMCDILENFYKNPANQEKFEQWLAQKGEKSLCTTTTTPTTMASTSQTTTGTLHSLNENELSAEEPPLDLPL